MELTEVMDMCDHLKLDRMLDEYLAAGRINTILQSRKKSLTTYDFSCFEPETKILLWDETDIVDALLPQERQISTNCLENNLCRTSN